MKKRSAVIAVVILACLTAGLFLFYRMDGHEANVRGEWMSGTDVVLFRKDGSCSTSFSHRPEWWDSADRYKVERDGTLHLTSGEGDLDESLRLTHSRREALENGKTYFVSKKTLILRKVKYERSK